MPTFPITLKKWDIPGINSGKKTHFFRYFKIFTIIIPCYIYVGQFKMF